jgi:hypothetical protein
LELNGETTDKKWEQDFPMVVWLSRGLELRATTHLEISEMPKIDAFPPNQEKDQQVGNPFHP